MSLYSSIQLANNSLRAAQIGLQVVGQNIANANTPGYTREEVLLAPAPTQRTGGLLLGLGVEVKGVVQKIDQFLEERLRGATSDRTGAEVEEQTYLALEGLIGELNDTDLSTAITQFLDSIHEVLNQPESIEIRHLAVQKGEILTGGINRLAKRVDSIRFDLNKRVVSTGDDINRLTEEIQTLNIRIATAEGGDASASEAVGLRDQRNIALTNLAKLINIRVAEQPGGGLAVFSGGEFLVFEGTRREVAVKHESDRGLSVAHIELAETQSPLNIDGGEVGGLINARDQVLGGFLDRFDDFSATLAFEFNKVYSRGQGLRGFDQVTSEFAVDSQNAALDEAGLAFSPVNGALEVLVHNTKTGQTKTHSILVDLNGLDEDTTLADLATTLDAVDGVSATITSAGQLALNSDSADSEFAFANDTSGVLAALGINTFFSGSESRTIGISQVLAEDPAKFAASQNGIGEDADIAVELAAFLDQPLESANGLTLTSLYDRLIATTTQGSTVARSVAEGFRVFEQTLVGQQLATSGVSLDEEAVKMITLQKIYQASARYISTLAELLDILVKL